MTSFAALSGAPVLSGSVLLPFAGAWVAGLVLDAGAPPTGAVTLTLDEGGVTLAGTLIRARETFGRVEVLVVGGAGGLWREVEGRHYRSVTASLVWQAVLAECGEAPSAASASALLGKQLAGWTRMRGKASDALQRLTDAIGGIWRVQLDGTVRLLDPAATEAGVGRGTKVLDCPADASAIWALDAHTLTPGQLLDGRRVRDLEHLIHEGTLRTRVWYG